MIFLFVIAFALGLYASPIPGVCSEEANKCLISLTRITSSSECGMPPETAASTLDSDTLNWGVCACPKLIPIFKCFEDAKSTCPGAMQYINIYGDQIDRGCKIVAWSEDRKRNSKMGRFFF